MPAHPYRVLALSLLSHFVVMYALTFVPVHVFADLYPFNLRSLYNALIMVAPMLVLMLLFMRHMYGSSRLNALLYAAAAGAFITTFFFIRYQTFVGDEQFIRSMIPHHSSAITMCAEASIRDPELQRLCGEIIRGQQEEIDHMRDILERLER